MDVLDGRACLLRRDCAGVARLPVLAQAVARTGSQLPMFFLNLTPVFAAMMSIALLGEFPYPYHLVGLALIVSGIFMANRPSATTAKG